MLPVEYALATGHVGLVVVVSESAATGLLVGLEAGLGLVLAGALWTAATSPTEIAAWLLVYAGLVGSIWYLGIERGQIWVAVVLLWVVLALSVYGLHRHELVTLGLTGGDHDQ